jgi:hypothetical protein
MDQNTKEIRPMGCDMVRGSFITRMVDSTMEAGLRIECMEEVMIYLYILKRNLVLCYWQASL